ncbi:MAG: hypothetical protein P3A28_06215 [Gemmatimonadota bacterium]|nr:hypothetical protein [Gemmatimonadota bacterium]
MRILRTLVRAALIPSVPAALAAQVVCKPAADTPESQLIAYFAGPLAFGAMPGTFGLTRGRVVVAGELTAMPSPPSAISRSSGACGFNKSENSELAPVFPRPRIAVGLGHYVTVEASFLPPVTVADATPHLGGIAVSVDAPHQMPLNTILSLRLHATLGGVDGPVTCPEKALQLNSTATDCYGTTPSDDTYEPNVTGLEAIVRGRAGGLRWHAVIGANSLRSRFRVNFTDGRGFEDRNVVEAQLTRIVVSGGAAWMPRPDLTLSAQAYSVPEDATTVRLGIAWRLR